MKKRAQKSIAKALHKWVGLTVSIFMLLFCISGIIFNPIILPIIIAFTGIILRPPPYDSCGTHQDKHHTRDNP